MATHEFSILIYSNLVNSLEVIIVLKLKRLTTAEKRTYGQFEWFFLEVKRKKKEYR